MENSKHDPSLGTYAGQSKEVVIERRKPNPLLCALICRFKRWRVDLLVTTLDGAWEHVAYLLVMIIRRMLTLSVPLSLVVVSYLIVALRCLESRE